MNLKELKAKSPADLLAFAEELQIENASVLRKQDMMFAILKQQAENDVPIYGSGVLAASLFGCEQGFAGPTDQTNPAAKDTIVTPLRRDRSFSGSVAAYNTPQRRPGHRDGEVAKNGAGTELYDHV